jgi:hypothetical protein
MYRFQRADGLCRTHLFPDTLSYSCDLHTGSLNRDLLTPALGR